MHKAPQSHSLPTPALSINPQTKPLESEPAVRTVAAVERIVMSRSLPSFSLAFFLASVHEPMQAFCDLPFSMSGFFCGVMLVFAAVQDWLVGMDGLLCLGCFVWLWDSERRIVYALCLRITISCSLSPSQIRKTAY